MRTRNKSAVLFITHDINCVVDENFTHLKNGIPDNYDLFYCCPDHIDVSEKTCDGFEYFQYDNSTVSKGIDPDLGFMWFNPLRVLERFHDIHYGKYAFYYVVEFDVYTPDWCAIFDIIENGNFNDTDLLASYIYRLGNDNGWCYYRRYIGKHPDDNRDFLSSLLSFMRISYDGMCCVKSHLNDDICNDIQEMYYPTLLYNDGYTIKSLCDCDDFSCGLKMVEREYFHVCPLFLDTGVLFETGKLYHRLKNNRSVRNFNRDIDFKFSDVLSFKFEVGDRYWLNDLLNSLVGFGFKSFEFYNTNKYNNFICHKFAHEVIDFVDEQKEDFVVKCYKRLIKPFSIQYIGEDVNIMHLNGYSRNFVDMDAINLNKIRVPDNLTIVTVETDITKSPLIRQLERSNVRFINGFNFGLGLSELNNKNLTLKIDYIYEALKNVNTEYVMFLDSRDTVIMHLHNIFEKYEKYGCDIVFGTDPGAYPQNYESIVESHNTPLFLNSGTVLGKTDTMRHIYGTLSEIRRVLGITKTIGTYNHIPMDSGDQGFIRKYVDVFNCWYQRKVIGCDLRQTMFISMLNKPMYISYDNELAIRNA